MLEVLAVYQTIGLFILDVTVSWTKPCLKGFCLMILDDSWDEKFRVDGVNVCADLVMQPILDVMVPLKMMRVKSTSNPWMHDANITISRHQRDWLHHKAMKSGNPEDWDRYGKNHNLVTALI